MTATASRAHHRTTSVLRLAELGSIALGVVVIGALHLVPPTSGIDPLAVTISEYGRSPLAAVFVIGVVLIAAGSTVTLLLLVRSGACRAISVPSVALALWVLGMVGVAVFQKADWAAGATLEGYIHRAASVVAFIALPVAVLALTAGEVRRRGRPRRGSRFDHHLLAVALSLAVLILAGIVAMGVFVAVGETSGLAWWTMIPLGAVERMVVAAELAALVMLVVALRVPATPE